MVNRPKNKGTAYETRKKNQWKSVFPKLTRASNNLKSWDLAGAPFPIECKHRKVWAIPEWTRALRGVAPGVGWMLLVAPGDGRKTEAPPEVCVMPMEMALMICQVAFDHEPNLLKDALG